ncbi:MAG: hypothetical protein LBE08_13080, partial [Bifidobacteriaceae bacterium]|nr:hypothetical protein [Bifidobacteriaceae bacterium]
MFIPCNPSGTAPESGPDATPAEAPAWVVPGVDVARPPHVGGGESPLAAEDEPGLPHCAGDQDGWVIPGVDVPRPRRVGNGAGSVAV